MRGGQPGAGSLIKYLKSNFFQQLMKPTCYSCAAIAIMRQRQQRLLAGEMPGPKDRAKRTIRGRGIAPTMSDVAQRAGVSAMTVSRALRDGASIARETRGRIMQAVEELGYVLDLSAGSLSSKRTGFVAALIPSINNSNFADTARGLTDALEGTGLQLLLGYTDYSVEKEESLIASMLRRRPEAIVVTGGRHTPRGRKLLQNSGIPVIETWDLPMSPVHHVVGFSNAEASAALVRHLHGRGYKRIAFIGGTTNRDTRGADRRAGYETAMNALGLTESRVISFGPFPCGREVKLWRAWWSNGRKLKRRFVSLTSRPLAP
jgi:LacI family transcriptional regulator, gluconate utilization system Gnt-I transcriptional repressor